MFKVALLPYRLYRKALSIAKNYEEGNLRPPSGCGQRQRLSVTGSTFNFLKSLEPLDVNHQAEIQILLENWEKTGIRPEVYSKIFICYFEF